MSIMATDVEVALQRGPERYEALYLDAITKPKALARLGEFTNLIELRIEKERALPPSIGSLSKLRELWLGPALREVPDELAALGPTLERLTFLDGVSGDVAERVVKLLAPAKRLVSVVLAKVDAVPPSLTLLRGSPLTVTLEPRPGADLPAMVDVLRRAKLDALELAQRKARKTGPDLDLAALAPLKKLRRLLLRWSFTALPDALGELAALEELELDRCAVRALPDGLRRLKKLRVLKADGGKLSKLPDWLGELSSLRELHLPSNGLTALPDSIGALASLEVLELAGNKLARLPESAAALKNLRVLGLRMNRLAALPGALVEVPELSIDRNPCADAVEKVRVTPEELVRVASDDPMLPDDAFVHQQPLKLTIVMPNLRALPPSFARLARLEEVQLECEELDLGQAIDALSRATTLRQLVVVRGRGIPPPSLGRLVGLTTLKFINSGLTALPDTLGALTRLQSLNLALNPLRALPETIGRCVALETLWLEGAQVARLPDALVALPKLRRLGLHGCPLEALPDGLARLPLADAADESLQLVDTRFTTPPPVLSKLACALQLGRNTPAWDPDALFDVLAANPRLHHLQLAEGSVDRLPPALGRLAVKRLDLYRLPDVAVPPELAGCTTLERLDLEKGHDAAGIKEHLPPGRWKKGASGDRQWFTRTG